MQVVRVYNHYRFAVLDVYKLNMLINRLVSLGTTLILISLAVFFVFQILPGDPALIILGPDADPYQLEALNERLNLHMPMHLRYIDWVKSALQGDFGTSLRYNMPVSALISARIPVTAALALLAVIMSAVSGIFLGVVVSRYAQTPFGKLLSAFTQLGLAIPTFWLGLMLSLLFGIVLRILPVGEFVPFEESFAGALRSLFLPALSLSVGNSAVIIRFMKNTISENLALDYVRTAKSRGLSPNRVLFKHVLRNALIPVITILGIIAADTLSGSIIIENVFNIPGVGQLIVTAINTRDLPLIQALSLYIAFIVVMVNFLVDFVYGIIDPRIELK